MAWRIVIDSNLSLGLFIKLPYSDGMDRRMAEWRTQEAELFVPALWEYEYLTGLTRVIVQKMIVFQEADRIVEELLVFIFRRVIPSPELHHTALLWAERIGQSSTTNPNSLPW